MTLAALTSTSHVEGAPVDVRFMNAASLLLSLVACVATLGFVARWAFSHPAAAISRIVIEGDSAHYNALTLQANVGSRISGNFFTVDLARAREIFESVPWVRLAVVRREFPNRLRVKIEEHRSAALWGADTESRMVNGAGEVFEANPGEAQSQALPRLVGAEGQSAQMLWMYQSLSSALRPLDVVVDELQLSGRGAWQAVLDTGAVIELGRGTPDLVLARLSKFLSTHKQVLVAYQRAGIDRVESVDLRHSDGYAIRLRGVSTVATTVVGK